MKKTKTDKTTRERQARRRALLNQKAREKGYKSLDDYLTAIINGRVDIMREKK